MKPDLSDPATRNQIREMIRTRGHEVPARELQQLLDLMQQYEDERQYVIARTSFLAFCRLVYPGFQEGPHHLILAPLLEDIAFGRNRFLAVSMPPRVGKSEFISYLFTAWYMGIHSKGKLMMATHTASLSDEFGRRVRNLLMDPVYQKIFPETRLSPDSKAADKWSTTKNGTAFYAGIGSALAGRGATCLVIDDPHDEKDALSGNPKTFEAAFEWYGLAFQRLQSKGAVLLIHCIAEGERIFTHRRGWVPVEDVRVGEQVWGIDPETRRPVLKPVTAHKCSGVDNILKVQSESAALRVNAAHPFLVVRGGAVGVAQTSANRNNWSLEWVKAGDLRVGDRVVHLKSKTTEGNHNKTFAGVQQPLDYYWLMGFMAGDGWAKLQARRSYVCAALSVYPELNDRVVHLMEQFFGRRPYTTRHGYVRLDSTSAAKQCVAWGLDQGARGKRVPEWMFAAAPGKQRAYLEGFIAADGHTRKLKATVHKPRKDTQHTVGIANEALLDDLRLLARSCGYRTTKIYCEKFVAQPPNSPAPVAGTTYRARFSDKHQRVERRHQYANQGQFGFGRYFRIERVESITPDGTAPVYDLTVEGAESFIAEGFVVHNTRWAKNDLIGNVLQQMEKNPLAPQYKYVELPMELPSGAPLWPERFDREDIALIKNAIPLHRWMAQYHQQPTNAALALVAPDQWQRWKKAKPPEPDYIIISLDAAIETSNRSDFNVFGVWYIFARNAEQVDHDNETPDYHIILVDVLRERMEYPELKRTAIALAEKYSPDIFIIEKKANGAPLIQDLKRMRLPILPFEPTKDKTTRLQTVSDLFEMGVVWIPDGYRWAEEFITEVADFPNGLHDDCVDVLSQTLAYFKKGSFGPRKLYWDRPDEDTHHGQREARAPYQIL